jgi:hypothetical protein
MRAGKIIAIIGLVLLVLSVILFFVFDIQTFLAIPSIILIIGGVITYLYWLGRQVGAVK